MTGENGNKSPRERLAEVNAQLFFIVGCGRSGTTLLQGAICATECVSIPPETKFFEVYPRRTWRYGRPGDDKALDRCVNAIHHDQSWRGVVVDPERFRAFAHAAERNWAGLFLALLTAYADNHCTRRVGEKSPVHTRYVGQLMRWFPEARFIHVLRDPRAVVRSRMTAGFGTSLIGPNIARWREAARMHSKFGTTLGPKRYTIVRYENLVLQPEPTLRDLCTFLDLEFNSAMLEPHKRKQQVYTERSATWMDNTLKPIFTSSICRWRSEMPHDHIALVEHALGEEMTALGYEPIGARTFAPRLKLAGSNLGRSFESRWRAMGRAVNRVLRSVRSWSSGRNANTESAQGKLPRM